MKNLAQFFPQSKLEVIEVEGDDFKMVENQYSKRRRSSIWFVNYSHLSEEDKVALANNANQYNELRKQVKELEDKMRDLKRDMKKRFCKTVNQ